MPTKELEISYPNIGSSNIGYAHCPNCGRMYPLENEKGKKIPLPAECERCVSPMDPEKALAFAEANARRENIQALTAQAERARGSALTQPPADRMVRGAANR